MPEYKPYIPGYDWQVDLPTFQDVTEYILDLFDLSRDTARHLRLAKQSIIKAYRDLSQETEWNVYYRRATLLTSAQYETGSITYDHTGGTYEREVTLATGTWPSWARFGTLIVDSVEYRVEDRKSDTVITLREHSNPGADVAAGTSYALLRACYPLPNDFRRMIKWYDTANEYAINLTDFLSLHRKSIYEVDNPSTPWEAVLRGSGDFYHNLVIEFTPAPDEARTYDYAYYCWPRPLITEKYRTGTVTVTAGATTVTLTGGTFPNSCVGSVIRFSSTAAAEPTGLFGNIDGADNPYYGARVIVTRTDDTHVELDSSMASTLTGVKYVVSDPVHMNTMTMRSALEVMAEYNLSRRVRNPKEQVIGKKDVQQALIHAREAESIQRREGRAGLLEMFGEYDYTNYES